MVWEIVSLIRLFCIFCDYSLSLIPVTFASQGFLLCNTRMNLFYFHVSYSLTSIVHYTVHQMFINFMFIKIFNLYEIKMDSLFPKSRAMVTYFFIYFPIRQAHTFKSGSLAVPGYLLL